jgi:RimJ/RimL family protein N-acetyltransferase
MDSTTFDQPLARLPIRMQTARLILRPFEERDTDLFWQYRADPEVSRYQGWSEPYTREMAVDFVEYMSSIQAGEPGKWFQYAAELKATGQLIGDVGFVRLQRDPRQAEIGFTLAQAYQHQGYASEAVSCLLDYLFTEFHLHRVRGNCDPQNTDSARLMNRVGMRREGLFIESIWFKGRWGDELWYAILRREWEALRSQH